MSIGNDFVIGVEASSDPCAEKHSSEGGLEAPMWPALPLHGEQVVNEGEWERSSGNLLKFVELLRRWLQPNEHVLADVMEEA